MTRGVSLAHMQAGNGDLAKLIVRARRARGWTAEELSRQTGLSVKTISRLETGRSKEPKQPTRERLARALDIDEATLAGERPTFRLSYPIEDALARIETKLDRLLSALPGYDEELDRLELEAETEERARQSEQTAAAYEPREPGRRRQDHPPRPPS
jgi:transcriptional regulator with XRE-family HTH domain